MGLRPSFPLMRVLVATYILLAGTVLFAAAFKSYAPNNWKLVSQKGDNAIYKNTASEVHETIVLQAFPAQTNDAELITHLNLQTLTREREKFLNGFGIGNYTALAVKTGRAKDPRFNTYTEIDSLYRDLQNRDVQMIERQFVANGTMYVISYLIDGPAINDRKRANRALDSFQPIRKPHKNAELEPHLEPINVASLFSCNSLIATGLRYLTPEAHASDVATSSSSPELSNNSPSTARSSSPVIEEKMSDAEVARKCREVPPELRRTAADSTYLGYVKTSLKTPGSCLAGITSNAWDMLEGAYVMLKGTAKFILNSEYRSEVKATVAVLAAEIRKSPSDFAMRVASEMAAAIQKYAGETFPCLKPTEQIKAVCKLASGLASTGMLPEVLRGAPLASERLHKLSTLARQSVEDLFKSKPRTLEELYARAPAAKKEIDDFAEGVVAKLGGSVAKTPLKGLARATEKLTSKYNGNIDDLKDVVRNTIVVSEDKIQAVENAIRSRYPKAKVERISPESNDRGWSMVQVEVTTNVKISAEIQINSPEMIYAGFKEPDARSVLGDSTYDSLSKKIGMRGGLSHILYERVRVLGKSDPQRKDVEYLCFIYHKIIRLGAARTNQSQPNNLKKEFEVLLDKYITEYHAYDLRLELRGEP